MTMRASCSGKICISWALFINLTERDQLTDIIQKDDVF